jgi:hypothetical protein
LLYAVEADKDGGGAQMQCTGPGRLLRESHSRAVQPYIASCLWALEALVSLVSALLFCV